MNLEDKASRISTRTVTVPHLLGLFTSFEISITHMSNTNTAQDARHRIRNFVERVVNSCIRATKQTACSVAWHVSGRMIPLQIGPSENASKDDAVFL